MLTNRFSNQTILLVVTAIALLTLLTVNAYLAQRREGIAVEMPQNAQATEQSVNPDTYYPLPPGKQTALMNAARRACLHPGHGVQIQAVNPDTYYPLPPGKQTALVNAAIQACIDDYLSEQSGK